MSCIHKVSPILIFFFHIQALKQQSMRYKAEKTYSTCEGERESNIRKNRYKDILPCEYQHYCWCNYSDVQKVKTTWSFYGVSCIHPTQTTPTIAFPYALKPYQLKLDQLWCALNTCGAQRRSRHDRPSFSQRLL